MLVYAQEMPFGMITHTHTHTHRYIYVYCVEHVWLRFFLIAVFSV